MEKFIVLHKGRIPGAIVGTETGKLLPISKDQINDENWMKANTSTELLVYKFDETIKGSIIELPSEVMGKIKEKLSLSFSTVHVGRFEVILSVAFSPSAKIWIVTDNPLIQLI